MADGNAAGLALYAEQLHRDLMEVVSSIDWLRRALESVVADVGRRVEEVIDRG